MAIKTEQLRNLGAKTPPTQLHSAFPQTSSSAVLSGQTTTAELNLLLSSSAAAISDLTGATTQPKTPDWAALYRMWWPE